MGYEGLCWKCKAEQERNAAHNWTAEEIAQKQENLLQNILLLSEFQDPECTDFWKLLGYRDAITQKSSGQRWMQRSSILLNFTTTHRRMCGTV